MQRVNVTTLDDGDLVAKINETLQRLGRDIVVRPDVTTKRVTTIKILHGEI